MTSVISKETQVPLTKVVESQPAFDATEILANQPMHQPDKTNELNIKSIAPPPVVPVSQFVPEVSEWIGKFVKAILGHSSSTEAKISLQPEHLGPIQIKDHG